MSQQQLPRGLTILKKLGAGGTGTVFLCQHYISKRKFVVKIFPDCENMRKSIVEGVELPVEIALLRSIHHKNIVKYKSHYLHQGDWYLVMDYDPGFTDLYTFSRTFHLTEQQIWNIAHQLYTVVKFCLLNGIDHGDLKEENLLYNDKTGEIKLIDFGTASPSQQGTSYDFLRGTQICLPPEAFTRPCYFPLQATVWAMGCILYGVSCCKAPFDCKSDILTRRARVPKGLRAKYSPKFVNLIERCLDPNPVTRILWSEISKNL